MRSSSGRYDRVPAVRAAAMSDPPHYRFPPASAYRLNRCLFALKSDDAFRTRFLKDARAAMGELELDAEDPAGRIRISSSWRTCACGWSASRSRSSFFRIGGSDAAPPL